MFKIRIGPKDMDNNEEESTPKNGWVAMWQALATIVLILACLAYCSRDQIVEIMR